MYKESFLTDMAEREVEYFSGVKTAQNSKTEGAIERTRHENVKLKKEDKPEAILPRENQKNAPCAIGV